MTTIAYRDGVLAVDSLCTWGDARDGRTIKATQRGRVLAAGAGKIASVQAFLDWFRGGMDGDPPKMGEEDKSAFGFIFPGGATVVTWSAIGWERCDYDVFTAGSGGEYARGALEMGATPEEAVAVAIKHDTKSGGPILVLHQNPPR